MPENANTDTHHTHTHTHASDYTGTRGERGHHCVTLTDGRHEHDDETSEHGDVIADPAEREPFTFCVPHVHYTSPQLKLKSPRNSKLKY